jgi:hypothetical protein
VLGFSSRKYDDSLSSFAFNSNLRSYDLVTRAHPVIPPHATRIVRTAAEVEQGTDGATEGGRATREGLMARVLAALTVGTRTDILCGG